MSGSRDYGSFVDTTKLRAISEMFLTLVPLDFVAHWGRCGMTADFIAHYFAYNFDNTAAAENVMSTVLNELIENIAKFSSEKRTEASLSVVHYGETVCITTVNVTSAARKDALVEKMEQIERDDIDELFMKEIERTVETKRAASGIGLFTILRDYQCALGVRISELPGKDRHEVVVQVSLDVEELEQQDFAPRSRGAKPSRRFEPPPVSASE